MLRGSVRLPSSTRLNLPHRSNQLTSGRHLPRPNRFQRVGTVRCSPRDPCPLICPGVSGGTGGGGGGRGDGRHWTSRWWNSDGNGPSGKPLSLLCLLFACQAFEAQASPNRRRNRHRDSASWNGDPDINQYATHLTDLAWPVLQNLGFSGVVGIVCAIAFKAIGRAVAIGLGTTFAIVQLLAYGGFVTVQWSKIHEDILRMCDVDGDGRFGATDMHDTVGSLLAMLSQGLPSVSGFCLGFGIGLRF